MEGKGKMTPLEELLARQELKALVDSYANESDKNNQDFYVNVFTEDCHVRVYFNNKLGMDLKNVHDLIKAYKGFGAAKESFHMNGQQYVEFQDSEHATGTCYALAHLVNEKDGKDMLVVHGVRYYDKYVKKMENGELLNVSNTLYFRTLEKYITKLNMVKY